MHYCATKTKSKKERLISHAQFCTVFSELMALTMLRKVTEIFLGDASGMNNDVKLKKISPAAFVFRQCHQLHGNLRTSSCGKLSHANFSALPTRLPGEGPRQY